MDIHNQLKCDEKENSIVQRLVKDVPIRYTSLKDVLITVNDAFKILYCPDIEAIPETYLIISIVCHWLVRYFCKRLMQVLTPEGLAVHFHQIHDSLRKCYIYHQEHFSLKSLIKNHKEKMLRFK